MALAPEQTGIGIRRHFSTEGVDPYDEVTWERRDARITNYRDGTVAFEQLGVEFPVGWSQNATNIVAQKYFRGTLGTPEREWSLQAGDQPGGVHRHRLGPARRLLRRRGRGRRLPRRAHHPPAPPAGRLQLPGVVQHRRHGRAAAGQCLPALRRPRLHARRPDPDRPAGRAGRGRGQGLRRPRPHQGGGGQGQRRASRCCASTPRPATNSTSPPTTSSGAAAATHPVGSSRPASFVRRQARVAPHRVTRRGRDLPPRDGRGRPRRVAAGRRVRRPVPGHQPVAHHRGHDGHRRPRRRGSSTPSTPCSPTSTATSARVVTVDASLDCRRTRLYGAALADFVERWDLMTRGVDMAVPEHLFTAPLPVVAAYLRSLFQAEGYVSVRPPSAVVGLAMISQSLVRGIQSLLLRFGIFSRVRFAARRPGRPQGLSGPEHPHRRRPPPVRRRDRVRRPGQGGEARGQPGAARPGRPPDEAARDRAHRGDRRDRCLRHPDRERRVPERQRPGPQLLHPRRRGHDAVDPQLVHRGRDHLPGRVGVGRQPVQHPVVLRAPQGRRHRVRSGELHAGRRRVRPAPSSRAARPGGRPRWSSSTPTTPTSRTSSGARRSRSARPGSCATTGSTWTSTARTATPPSTRTPTTRSGSPTSSCRPSSTTPTGTCGPSPPASPSAPSRPATSSARSRRRPGSAPTPACSSTPPSTSGTPPPTPAASTGPTLAASRATRWSTRPGASSASSSSQKTADADQDLPAGLVIRRDDRRE